MKNEKHRRIAWSYIRALMEQLKEACQAYATIISLILTKERHSGSNNPGPNRNCQDF